MTKNTDLLVFLGDFGNKSFTGYLSSDYTTQIHEDFSQ